ncbi:hypothetical protein RvY_11214 [Ramazzottius varieornatus]|uniref:DUF659 domain-containing protein n=1 Tax=Ramazzottius varieornatus TaxID=947166 RepID=A0A1D1VHF7_RAMVA|nr:hypothetical protein RvY_11214 [Ramazzottius varieornatus]
MDRKTAEIVGAFLFHKLATIKLLESELNNVIYVTDAGSNVKAAFNLRNKPILSRITCAGHQLNTSIRNCFNTNPKSGFVILAAGLPVLDLRNEAKSLVDHCKRAAIVKHLKTTLKQEIETRWHSMIDKLASVLSAYDELVVVLLEREEADLLPDRERIQEMHDLFAPVKSAPETLSASKKPTIHLVIPVYHNLIQHFEHIHPSDHDDIRALQVHALNVFKAKLQPAGIHKMAVFLSPSMKRFLPESDRVKVIATVMKHVRQIGVPQDERALMPSADIGAPRPKSIFEFSNLCKLSNEPAAQNGFEKCIRMRNPIR